MCGIAGYVSFHKRDLKPVLTRLNEALKHRGPDDIGYWYSEDGCVGLGHRRLSIIDLSSAGKQPMVSSSGRYVTAFNGEIYNFLDMRKELENSGHCFRGHSDTEVMVEAIEEWGIEDSVKKFNGMFAAAVWDNKKQLLWVFRDRLGVKPLYYLWNDGVFYFSSEMTKPFAKIGRKNIDREALACYLRYNYIPAPGTIYKDVFKLFPGQLGSITRKSAAEHKFENLSDYWNMLEEIEHLVRSRDDSMEMEDTTDMLDAALERSVRQRMISDVPLGAFLSGGIDSSLVVAHMQKASSMPVNTFTIGFDEDSRDESAHAGRVARYLGTRHTELRVTERDALEVIPQLPKMYGEPFADSSQI
ncbi:asparagine synthase (glutamine-hydrolyzing), partial [Candidatus Woesearchaeota archaeon]